MQEWEKTTKQLLKSELARRGISYDQLSTKLKAMDINVSKSNLSNKINRGTFSAAFLLQVLTAIGAKKIDLDMDSD